MGTLNTKLTTPDPAILKAATFKPVVYLDGQTRDSKDTQRIIDIITNIKNIFGVKQLQIYCNDKSMCKILDDYIVCYRVKTIFHRYNKSQVMFLIGLEDAQIYPELPTRIKTHVSSTTRLGYIALKSPLVDVFPLSEYFQQAYYTSDAILLLIKGLFSVPDTDALLPPIVGPHIPLQRYRRVITNSFADGDLENAQPDRFVVFDPGYQSSIVDDVDTPQPSTHDQL